ncbi:hypothetical protein SISNIDRAFT_457975 [Sistotremastrum niveocremeum HHB9708]|uniref:Uncharacterized protein n=1 Tax=Sistotremastrum niveocremeum HHB9708 TaxID=1314777 RepID=A0A164QYJ5_9AGAM|nr:hypothetical protein SISNIDRAFT_457975 [Sistotremastrum niveocremeum HHB9708]
MARAGHHPYPPMLDDTLDFHHLAPVPPDLQPLPLHGPVLEPSPSPCGPENPFNMGVLMSHPRRFHSDRIQPQINPPILSPNRNQPWLNIASATKHHADNKLPVGPLADAQISSLRHGRDTPRSPSPRAGLRTSQSRPRAGLSSPYLPSVPVRLERSRHGGGDRFEGDDVQRPQIRGAAERNVDNVSISETSIPPRPHAAKLNQSSLLTRSELPLQRATPKRVILKLGGREIAVAESYLVNCQKRAFEIFPRKLAGLGGTIDEAEVPHVKHLAEKKLSPAKSALLLLVVHYGHINMEPSPANPPGLSVVPEEFTQLLIDGARDQLSAVVWTRIIKYPTIAIQATLLLGYDSLHDSAKWSLFLPILKSALAANFRVVLSRQGHGERFASGARGQEARRRASFGLMVLDGYHNPANYVLSDTDLDSVMPIDIQYDEIVEGALVPEPGVNNSSDIGLLILNGRLLFAKTRLVCLIIRTHYSSLIQSCSRYFQLSILGQIPIEDWEITRFRISKKVLTAIESYAEELNTAIISNQNYVSFGLEKALEKINKVLSQGYAHVMFSVAIGALLISFNSGVDLAKLIKIVKEVPLVDLEEGN